MCISRYDVILNQSECEIDAFQYFPPTRVIKEYNTVISLLKLWRYSKYGDSNLRDSTLCIIEKSLKPYASNCKIKLLKRFKFEVHEKIRKFTLNDHNLRAVQRIESCK